MVFSPLSLYIYIYNHIVNAKSTLSWLEREREKERERTFKTLSTIIYFRFPS